MKKIKLLLIFLFIPFILLSQQTKGGFFDSRDNNNYKWVKIGEQIWMSENLKYKTDKGSQYFSSDSTRGLLYNYESLLNGMKPDSNFQGVCPNGWHVPTVDEWGKLFLTVGRSFCGQKLKSQKFKGGDDSYGFNILPNGKFYTETLTRNKVTEFENKDTHAYFWSCTERDQYTTWGFFFYSEVSTVGKIDVDKTSGLSVRCIKNK